MLKKACVFAGLLGVAATAAADGTNTDRGFELGVGGGHFKLEAEDAGLRASLTGGAVKGMVGYRLNQYFSGEVQFVYGEPSDTIQGVKARVKGRAWIPGVVGTLPVNDWFSVHAKAGYAFWHEDYKLSVPGFSLTGTDSDSSFMWGAGVGFMLDGARIRAEYEQSDLDDITKGKLFSLNIVWFF